MGSTSTRSRRLGEPSPPFDHVSWRDDEYHDADADMAILAEIVMSGDEAGEAPAEAARGSTRHLQLMARYPWWVVSVRALVGAALVAFALFAHGAWRYDYFVHSGGEAAVDQDALLAGLQLASAGSVAGLLLGAGWGFVVYGCARRHLRPKGGQPPRQP